MATRVALEIRPARRSDLGAIDRLLGETFGQTAGSAFGGASLAAQRRLRRVLRRLDPRPTDGLLVATDGAAIAGVIALETDGTATPLRSAARPALRLLGPVGGLRFLLAAWVARYRPAPAEAYLSCLAVAPSYRRRGLGERLLAAAEREAWRRGKTLLSLLVARDNRASLALCQKLGFRPGRPTGWRRLRPFGRTGFIYLQKRLG
jgi:ribosomal protein S18 acetylase RimI-like enzyme